MRSLQAEVEEFLKKHGSGVDAQSIVNDVEKGVAYKKIPCQQGDLHLIRLYHPVIMRQEMFLGNVLFNAYLGLAMKHTLESELDIDVLPVFNDLSSYYFLVHTVTSLNDLIEKIKNSWIDGLEDLYFSEPSDGETDEYAGKGYYGRFSTMLQNYFKSNIQPFPLMIVPIGYARKLERRIRQYLLEMLESGDWQKQIANFTANFSFFYGQTSGGTGDVQSCPNFLRRLVAEYHVIEPKEMIAAFNLPAGTDFTDPETKNLIQSKLFQKGDPAYYPDGLKQVFKRALQHFADSIESSNPEEDAISDWLFRYHREKGVFLDETPEKLMNQLAAGVTIAGRSVSDVQSESTEESCLLCGCYPAKLQGATILASDSFSKFHNHSINRGNNEKRICLNCALYAYLNIKFTGSKGAGMGQVPRQGNVVFHYGSYTGNEIEEMIKTFEEQSGRVFAKPNKDIKMESSELLDDMDWFFSQSKFQNLKSMFRGNDGGEAYLFPIEFGTRQLLLFVLPGLDDDVQKRFNQNWYATRQLLSWLTEIGGKAGPYYYLSLPHPQQVIQNKSVLVINGKEFDTETQLQLHDLYLQVVPELSQSRLKDGFKHQMMMAERFQADPLGRLSDELRFWMSEGKLSADRRERFFTVYGKIQEILEMEGLRNAN
ncbi:hypothetical protein [Effusibacillus consociatus]|uniref:Type I-B CRISPR-associated protein Cas8b1/Cst1 n=1 Tax=Effusibacillus consociatus TaxID=1117041 RepID=A0ABV9Q4X9_9BACL